ncbi:MAG: WYL domain-containing transcriptional regulator [Armatimonadota bacterium]|nr:WYL domain-containing transcriptional regulator [bacterium]
MAKSALLIRTIELLKKRPGMTVRDLAVDLDRSERTIYRWLSELAGDLGTPIYCNNGGYYINEQFAAGTVDLMPEEILALRLSLRSSPFGSSSPIGAHAQSAWRKIRDAVSCDDLIAARDMSATHSVRVNASSFKADQHIISALEIGVNNRHRLRALYYSQNSGKVKEYLLDPYAMVFRRHSWYLLAFSHQHGEVRQFKLVRFKSVIDTHELFNAPTNFDADEFFHLSWEAWAGGEPTVVRVRFSPRVAPIIEESKRHTQQVLYPQPDGSVIFEVCVAGIEEIAIWIMGYGKDAEVLEPKSLREHILDHAREMLALYSFAEKKVEQFAGGLT